MLWGQKSGVMTVFWRGTSGRLYIQDGQVIHATFAGEQGEAAAHRLLSREGGSFTWEPGPTVCPTSIETSTQNLLLEAARRLDEGQEPPPTTKSSAQPPNLAIAGYFATPRR
jgi:hypothetical protein